MTRGERKAHFNGKQIVSDEPFDLPPDSPLMVTVMPKQTGNGMMTPEKYGCQSGAIFPNPRLRIIFHREIREIREKSRPFPAGFWGSRISRISRFSPFAILAWFLNLHILRGLR